MLTLPIREKICPYCNKVGIKSFSDCTCGKFRRYKQKISQHCYFSNVLKIEDETGFCSAGILPYFVDTDGTIFVLFLLQSRFGKIALNFAGGKRDSQKYNETLVIPETSIQTAKYEFIEEIGELIDNEDNELLEEVLNSRLDKVFWTGKNKMAIYFLEVKYNLCHLKRRINQYSEAINYHIMPVQEMFLYKEIYHGWVYQILNNMRSQFENDKKHYQKLKILFEF